jgi:hypothetical protein
MSRRTIRQLFFGSLIAIISALIVLTLMITLAVTTNSFVVEGSNVVGVQSAWAWVIVAVCAIAGFVILAAAIAQVAAWIGALIATVNLESKTWFVVLLVAGLLGFSFIAMLIYLLVDSPDTHQRPSGTREAMA